MNSPSPLITCPSCQKKFTFKPELAGKKVKCPKCAKPFVVQAPIAPVPADAPAQPAAEASYDLAPEAPRSPAPAPVTYVRVPVQERKPQDQGPDAVRVLANSARIGARGGLVGLAGGLAFGGLLLAFNKKPKMALWILLGSVAGILLLCVGLGFITMALQWFTHPGYRSPSAPPTPMAAGPGRPGQPDALNRFRPPGQHLVLEGGQSFPTEPVGGIPSRYPPTEAELIRQAGADHVFHMTINNVTNPTRDPVLIRQALGPINPDSYSVTFTGTQAQCVFLFPAPFDTFLHTLPPFLKVDTSDPAAHTLTATLTPP